jgi:WD40 repeat protein
VLQTGHNAGIKTVALSPNGQQLLTGSSDKTALLWDVASGRRLRALVKHSDGVVAVAFSPDGKTLLTAGDRRIILWDATLGRPGKQFPAPARGRAVIFCFRG